MRADVGDGVLTQRVVERHGDHGLRVRRRVEQDPVAAVDRVEAHAVLAGGDPERDQPGAEGVPDSAGLGVGHPVVLRARASRGVGEALAQEGFLFLVFGRVFFVVGSRSRLREVDEVSQIGVSFSLPSPLSPSTYLPVLRNSVLEVIVERSHGRRVLERRDEVLRGEVGAVFFLGGGRGVMGERREATGLEMHGLRSLSAPFLSLSRSIIFVPSHRPGSRGVETLRQRHGVLDQGGVLAVVGRAETPAKL